MPILVMAQLSLSKVKKKLVLEVLSSNRFRGKKFFDPDKSLRLTLFSVGAVPSDCPQLTTGRSIDRDTIGNG
jgi:hypothetical protein